MCPKGDDPLTMDQNYRQIKLIVSENTGALTGNIGLRFQGKVSYIPLSGASDTKCMTALTNSRTYASIGCTVIRESSHTIIFNITFFSWPSYPSENNVYFHNGNPSIGAFTCDKSQTMTSITCDFEDIASTNIPGNNNHCICNSLIV